MVLYKTIYQTWETKLALSGVPIIFILLKRDLCTCKNLYFK